MFSKVRTVSRFTLAGALVAFFACGGEEGIPTVEDVQAEVFTPSCALAGCHAPQLDPQTSLDLTPPVRAKLVGVESEQVTKPLVDPGDVGNSYLVDKLVGMMIPAQTDLMPPDMPLPDDEIELVRSWIEAGAL